MVINLVELDDLVGAVVAELDHTHLDRQQPHFAERPSTGENIVAYLWSRLTGPLAGRLRWLKLWETPNNIFELGALNLGLNLGTDVGGADLGAVAT
jgi:6-pyruvoyl-tetrahydropterin synthase